MKWARSLTKRVLTEDEADVHMEEWGIVAREMGLPALRQAVMDVVRNDSEFFPAISEIRKRAGMNKSDREAVEADAAWGLALDHVKQHGFDGLPAFRGGKEIRVPALPERIQYAVRRVGGLRAIAMRELKSEPFMRQEFAEAYRLAPMAEQMIPQLGEHFAHQLLKSVAKALPGTNPHPRIESAADMESDPAQYMPEKKRRAEPLSDIDWNAKQQTLQAQKTELLQKGK